jgi:hypothetical protein
MPEIRKFSDNKNMFPFEKSSGSNQRIEITYNFHIHKSYLEKNSGSETTMHSWLMHLSFILDICVQVLAQRDNIFLLTYK